MRKIAMLGFLFGALALLGACHDGYHSYSLGVRSGPSCGEPRYDSCHDDCGGRWHGGHGYRGCRY